MQHVESTNAEPNFQFHWKPHIFKKVHSHFLLKVGCLPHADITVVLHILFFFLGTSYSFKLKGIQVQNVCQGPVANIFNDTLNNKFNLNSEYVKEQYQHYNTTF